MGCPVKRINEALEHMRKFDTSPGLQISKEKNHPIRADVIVKSNEDGRFSVFLADTTLPSLRINQLYDGMACNEKVDEKTRQFLKSCQPPA